MQDRIARLGAWLSGALFCSHGLVSCSACTREARALGLLPTINY